MCVYLTHTYVIPNCDFNLLLFGIRLNIFENKCELKPYIMIHLIHRYSNCEIRLDGDTCLRNKPSVA